MHMIRKNELNSSEMNILTKLCSPKKVITANLEKFLTKKVLKDTPGNLRKENLLSTPERQCT